MLELGLSLTRVGRPPWGAALGTDQIAGFAAAQAGAGGGLAILRALAGAGSALASVAGALQDQLGLGGATVAQAQTAGALVTPSGVSGALAALGTTTGAILHRMAVGAAGAGAATAAGAVSCLRPLAGSTSGTGTGTGVLIDGNTAPSGQNVSLVYDVPPGDVTAPLLSGSSPADGAIGVLPGAAITLSFSEPVVFGTGAVTLRNVTDASDIEMIDVVAGQGTGPGTVSISGADLTITPSANLPAGKSVAVRIAAGALTDLAGNAFAGIADDTTLDFAILGGPAQIRGFDAGGTTQWTASLGVALPAHQAGDLLLAFIGQGNGGAFQLPAGWSQVATIASGGDICNVIARSAASSGETLTAGFASNADCSGCALALTGGSIGNVAVPATGSGTSVAAPVVTVTGNDIAIRVGVSDRNVAFVPSPNPGSPVGFPAAEGSFAHNPANKSSSVEIAVVVLAETVAGPSAALSFGHNFVSSSAAGTFQVI